VTSPDDPRDNGSAVRPLDRLHVQALAGEVTVEEFLRACAGHALRAVESRKRKDVFLRDIDAEGYAQTVLANALRAAGGTGDQTGLFPEIRLMAAYLDRTVEYTLNSVHKQHKSRAERGQLPPLSMDAPIQGDNGDEIYAEVADPGAVIDVDAIAARAAYAKARRRIPRLREEACAGRRCPFHMTGPCPHADSVIDFLEKVIEFGPSLAAEDIAYWLVEKGRTLSMPPNRTGAGRKRQADAPRGLSDHDHTLDRHFRRCFEWWWYRAFVRTNLDPVTERPASRRPSEPSSAADPIRLPIVGRLRLKKNGDWQFGACSLPGALTLILPDEEFWRLLYTHKRDVYDYLEGKAS
jgi:hypothetical protein